MVNHFSIPFCQELNQNGSSHQPASGIRMRRNGIIIQPQTHLFQLFVNYTQNL